jgi:hypothetical protein
MVVHRKWTRENTERLCTAKMKMFLQPRENRILRLSFTHDSTKIPLETYTEKLPPRGLAAES